MDTQIGCLTALTSRGVTDVAISRHRHQNGFGDCGRTRTGTAQAAFGPHMVSKDGLYVASTMDYVQGGPTAGGNMIFLHARSSDFIRALWLKVTLPALSQPGTSWSKRVVDHLFEHISLDQGGYTMMTMSLKKNNAIARSRGMWPKYSNSPKNHDTSKEWTVAIPLMDVDVIPLLSLFWHDSRTIFEKFHDLAGMVNGKTAAGDAVFPVRVVFTVECIYLDQDSRRSIADGVPVVLAMDDASTIKKLKYVFKQNVTVVESVPETIETTMQIRLTGNLPTTYIICIYKLNVPVWPEEDPVDCMDVVLNASTFQHFDKMELEELNWLRCGVLSPMKYSKGRGELVDTFYYLIPFGSDCMVANDVATTWVNMGRLDRAVLLVTSKSKLLPGTLTVVAETLNVKKYLAGMCCAKFV